MILLLVSKLGGKGLGTLYQTYVYNINVKNYKRGGVNITLSRPLYVQPSVIELGANVRLQQCVRTIASPRQRIVIKDYTSLGAGATIIPGNHTPTVSSPQFLSYLGINDVNNTLTIEEDVWVGAGSTLLYKGSVGRGAIVAANAVVTKEVPPYAVVSGIPAKIIAVRFSVEQIIKHEESLYPKEKRFERSYLERLFAEYYFDKKVIGTSEITEQDEQRLKIEKERLGIADYFGSS